MKNSNFAACLGKYFKVYLPSISGRTPQTIDSYRYAFILFLTYMQEECQISADMVDITHLSMENILSYLRWLQAVRSNSVSTRMIDLRDWMNGCLKTI